VTTCKTVAKKCGHYEVEQYCVKGKCKREWHRTCDECCFDPCTCSTIVKKVPYTVTRHVTEVVRTQVPYTVSHRCLGAWVEAPGAGGAGAPSGATYDCAG